MPATYSGTTSTSAFADWRSMANEENEFLSMRTTSNVTTSATSTTAPILVDATIIYGSALAHCTFDELDHLLEPKGQLELGLNVPRLSEEDYELRAKRIAAAQRASREAPNPLPFG